MKRLADAFAKLMYIEKDLDKGRIKVENSEYNGNAIADILDYKIEDFKAYLLTLRIPTEEVLKTTIDGLKKFQSEYYIDRVDEPIRLLEDYLADKQNV